MTKKMLVNSALIWLIFFDNAPAQSGLVANPVEQVPAAVAEAEQTLDARKFIKEGLIPTEKADGCELHIWPTSQISSNSSGGLLYVGGILPGLIDSAIHSKQDSLFYSALNKSFDLNSQIDLLNIASIRSSMKMSQGTTIVPHKNKEDNIENYGKNRVFKSKSACYFELIVNKIAWVSTTESKSFESTFEFRVFGSSQTPKWVFKKTYKRYPFCFFPKPPKNPTVDFLSVCFTETFESSFQVFAEEMRLKVPPQGLDQYVN